LTLHQAILDFTYFAETVDLPFDTDHSSNAQNAPWVYSGGSYSGALSAWTESVAPSTFWAYHSSSAPVEAIEDFVSRYNCLSNSVANMWPVAILRTRPRGNASQLQQGHQPRDRLHGRCFDFWKCLRDIRIKGEFRPRIARAQ